MSIAWLLGQLPPVRKLANVRGSNHSFAGVPATSGTEHIQVVHLAMSQSKRNLDTSSCKASPLSDTQCRLNQWAKSPEQNHPSSSSTGPSTSSPRLSKRISSLTTANELKQHPYRDPEQLQTVFEQAGTIADTAAHFDISQTTARLWLIQYELYDPERQGMSSVANRLEELSPEDLGLPPLGEHQ
ncbi:hypothetical protein SAMN05421858_4862 [Haladaptatus litoreus]|uniref:Helix-turn-helix domain-containing protein n=1 Tax=Haladaptatus litoreus TaxID=553468 RepID=A0A1N7FA69_9EURY|nr:hypothetical protein SAMN05421858_4862 [Haladaptatus litoreus]